MQSISGVLTTIKRACLQKDTLGKGDNRNRDRAKEGERNS